MALRESIVQVVHHVHAFTQLLYAQVTTIVAAIAITTTKASSAQKVSAQVCRTMLHSAHRVVIVHAATMARVVTSSAQIVSTVSHEVVTASAHRVVMVVHSRVVMVALSRVVMVAHSRVVMVAHSRVVMVVLSRVVMVVLSRVVMVVHSRVVMVVHSRVAMASLMEHLLTRRVHVSTRPTTIQMQSTQ